jgi:circadian clock protein KaiC
MLRYFEVEGAVRQALSVIKKRSGNHERTIREIKISSSGFEISEPVTTLRGVLTGVPTFNPEKIEPPLTMDPRLE